MVSKYAAAHAACTNPDAAKRYSSKNVSEIRQAPLLDRLAAAPAARAPGRCALRAVDARQAPMRDPEFGRGISAAAAGSPLLAATSRNGCGRL